MGEAKKNRRGHDQVLAGDDRCIYCARPPTSIEHMPPKIMFRAKSRPDGMVFASCTACNNGTSAADLVAGFISRIRMDGELTDWQLAESYGQLTQIGRKAPDFVREFFNPAKTEQVLRRTPSGPLKPAVRFRVDGPVTKAYLSTFASKLGMALFREHTNAPLPLHGKVFSQWFMNAGLSQEMATTILSILPVHATLVQGKWSVGDQFGYRYNSDGRSIVAALAGFQGGLYIQVIATSEPEKNPFFTNAIIRKRPTVMIAGPGELAGLMPKRSYIPQLANMPSAATGSALIR